MVSGAMEAEKPVKGYYNGPGEMAVAWTSIVAVRVVRRWPV